MIFYCSLSSFFFFFFSVCPFNFFFPPANPGFHEADRSGSVSTDLNRSSPNLPDYQENEQTLEIKSRNITRNIKTFVTQRNIFQRAAPRLKSKSEPTIVPLSFDSFTFFTRGGRSFGASGEKRFMVYTSRCGREFKARRREREPHAPHLAPERRLGRNLSDEPR